MNSDQVLMLYNPKLPLILATDSSQVAVGAVLSHLLPDGTERPMQFASQTLTETQQKYSSIDREAYAIIFGVRKFYQYLFGTHFTLVTDHKPLLQIFGPHKGLPIYSASRMQHYAMYLQAFNYEIRYKNTTSHANADALSRLILGKTTQHSALDETDLFNINQIQTLPLTVRGLAHATETDPQLQILLRKLKSGERIIPEERFNINEEEYSIQDGCIIREIRPVIPQKLKKTVLDELHLGHFGMTKMKALARSYCWWAGIDANIEKLARNCFSGNKIKNDPAPNTDHIWERPTGPFRRVHIDFAGPFQGVNFFILVDAYSKWPEIHVINNTTSRTTIQIGQNIFTTHGLPKYIVSDNGPQLKSTEFQQFLKQNGIEHKCSAPYQPATNGQAEKFITCYVFR